MMKDAITQGVSSGFAAVATAFIQESLSHMVPWLIVSCAVILCDLAFGLRKSMLMKEEVRISRAFRRTMGKMVTYFSFVCMVCMINVAAGNDYAIDKWSCLLVCGIEFLSIISNILKPKGYSLILLCGSCSFATHRHWRVSLSSSTPGISDRSSMYS